MPLIKNILQLLAKSVLIPLGLTAAASAIDAAIQKKKKIGSGMTTLIISNEEMYDILKLIKSAADAGSLIKDVIKTIEN